MLASARRLHGMLIGLVYVILAAFCAYEAAVLGGLGLVLLWPALIYAAVAVGYFGAGASMLGKRSDGTHAPVAFALFFPYFALMYVAWRAVSRFGPSRVHDRVADGIYLGRRALSHELPVECDCVVDLTAEFGVTPGALLGRTYRCIPTLDGTAPDLDAVFALVEELRGWPGVIYVHCAAGHSRSACVVAALLIRRGAARDVDDAMKIIRVTRRYAWLGKSQRRMVMAYAARLAVA